MRSLEELQIYTDSNDAKIALLKVRQFDGEPDQDPKAVVFHYPTSAEPLNHSQVRYLYKSEITHILHHTCITVYTHIYYITYMLKIFDACTKAIKYAGEGTLESVQYEPLNVILATSGLDDRWTLRLDSVSSIPV